jgi:hypothetical protein
MGMLVGCGDPVSTVDDPTDGETYTYVLSTGDIPASAGGMGVGFNLDDAVSDGATEACNDAPDVTSSISGEVGVDNSLASVVTILGDMIEGGIQGALEEQIAAGTFLLLVEVTDVDSTAVDESVGVRLFLGTTTETITLEGGRIAPGQTFAEGTILASLPVGTAAIAGGTLSFSSDTLPLSLSIDGNDIMLTLRSAQLRADISSTGLTNGEIGASVTVADVVQLGEDLGQGDVVNEGTIRSLNLPDLEPTADDTVCDSISVGLSFEAVTANP